MSTPPHLPPKSCSVPLYKRLRLMESIVFVSIFAFVSGLVGGIVSDVYITPEYDAYTGVVQEARVVTRSFEQIPDAFFIRNQYRRMLSLVPRSLYENGQHRMPGAGINAVLLTDSGWFVAPILDRGIQANNLVALSSAGEVYEIESFVFDTEAGLVYGSLAGEGFRVVSFPANDALKPGTGVWIAGDGTLQRSILTYPKRSNTVQPMYQIGDIGYRSFVSDNVETGSVVWTEEGAFLGFVDNEGAIKPWFVVTSVYSSVFSGELISRESIPISGYIVSLLEDERAVVDIQYGFYIEKVGNGLDELELGDILVEIAGEPVAPWRVDALIAENRKKDIDVTILRSGTLVHQTISKDTRI